MTALAILLQDRQHVFVECDRCWRGRGIGCESSRRRYQTRDDKSKHRGSFCWLHHTSIGTPPPRSKRTGDLMTSLVSSASLPAITPKNRDIISFIGNGAPVGRTPDCRFSQFTTWIRSFSFSAHTASSTSLSGIKWNGSFTVNGRV